MSSSRLHIDYEVADKHASALSSAGNFPDMVLSSEDTVSTISANAALKSSFSSSKAIHDTLSSAIQSESSNIIGLVNSFVAFDEQMGRSNGNR